MTITAADIDDMLAFLATHPEYQERFRSLVVGKDLQGVPGRLDRIEAILETVAVRLDALTDRIDALTVRMDALTVRMDVLTVRMDALTADVQLLTSEARSQGKRLDRVEGRLGNAEGTLLEIRYARNFTNWFGRFLIRPLRVDVQDLEKVDDALERGDITSAEVDRLRDLDFIVAGRNKATGNDELLAAEISFTIFNEDIERAVNRALTLRRSGYNARPFAGGYEVDATVREAAEAAGVIVDIRQQKRS